MSAPLFQAAIAQAVPSLGMFGPKVKQIAEFGSGEIGFVIGQNEPVKVPGTRGYFAVARVQQVIPDRATPGMYLAIVEPGSYLDFPNPVPFGGADGLVERGLYNEQGAISGRAQAAVRPISPADFNRIISLGLAEDADLLPRIGDAAPASLVQEERAPFVFEQERDRVTALNQRPLRERAFRRVVLKAYDERCAITGLKLINVLRDAPSTSSVAPQDERKSAGRKWRRRISGRWRRTGRIRSGTGWRCPAPSIGCSTAG